MRSARTVADRQNRNPAGARKILWPVIALSLPALVVLTTLVALDRLDGSFAIVAGFGVVVAMALMVRSWHADIVAIAEYIAALHGSGAVNVPRLNHPGAFMPMLAGARRLRRAIDGALRRTMGEADESGLDNLPDPLLMLDHDRRVVRANNAARELLGPNPVGRDLASVLRNPALLQGVDQVLHGAAKANVEFSFHAPVERNFSTRIARIAPPESEGPCIVIALYDVTAIQRAEKMRSDFIADASHELRTPLSVLLGCIQTLRGSARDDPEAQAEFFGLMQGHAERMSRLVDDLLSLSRIELNEHTVPTDLIDIAAILGEVGESLGFKAKSRGMSIEFDCDPRLPTITGEREDLAQVFENLIDNAVKYGAANTPIGVTARLVTKDIPPSLPGVAECIAVAVADQGEGIPIEHQPRLTERFYRIDTARSRELGGTGLGLAIVKHVVNRHRGALTITSDPGEGSIFTVYLPTRPFGEDGSGDRAENGEAAAGSAAAGG